MSWLASFVGVLLMLHVYCVTAIDRLQLFPFGATQGDDRVDVGDDVSSPEVQLRTPIVFYDDTFSSLYVNLNGHISFETELPVYRSNFILPFGYKLLAPFLADVDTSLSGNVYYRETADRSLRDKAAEYITRAFQTHAQFYPENLFIATWNEVGYYDSQNDKTNTFQTVIASDGRESFVLFLYPDAINWIQGEGKDSPVSNDVPGQAGFDAGDNDRYYTLPGSGLPQVTQLARRSNIDEDGVWLFRVGDLRGENVHDPGSEAPGGDGSQPESCAAGGSQTCNSNAVCRDYATGFCCECSPPYIGNGYECVRPDEAQRISGKVSGFVNGFQINDVDLHAYVVTNDGRTYTAISRIPDNIGYSLQSLYAVGSILGFLFALPQQPALHNGFMLTGGRFNRSAVVEFEATGEVLTIRQTFTGQDVQGHMRISTFLDGQLPDIAEDAQVEVDDYYEEYRRISPGVLKSRSTQTLRIDSVQHRISLDQTITFDECPHHRDADADSIRIAVSRNFFAYTGQENIVRYSQTSRVPGTDQVDPCSDAQCDENADCIVHETTYRCECRLGYEGTGRRCQDVNECGQFPSPCDENAECFNTRGSYRCRFFPGFSGDGHTCQRDGDSCDVLRNCDRNARCVFDDHVQSYVCRCNPGFTGSGYECSPVVVDDCNDVADLCDENAQCLYDDDLQRYACHCNRGFEGDGRQCSRVDCRQNPAVCDLNARCLRRGREYFCVCMPGYHGDGYDQCIETAPTGDMLIYTQGMYIVHVPFEPSDENPGSMTLYIPGQTAVGIDVDCFTQYFYWTDVSGKAISRAKLDGTDSNVIVRRLGSPEGVAVDWISKNLYWTDSGTDRIEVSRLNGTHHKTLFSDDLVNPRAIVVDPVRGLMFWTDWNREAPKIEKANMDGTDRQSLVTEGLSLPNGLTIDYHSSQLCWADAGTHKVECANYDGRGKRTITESAPYPFGLAFHNGVLYWTDWERQTLPNINKTPSRSANEDLTLPQGANGRLYGISVVQSQCPPGSNPCAHHNGGCRFLCLPTSRGGRTCTCPDDIDPEECNRISLL